MSNKFKSKRNNEEVNLIHIGKMDQTNETVAIYEIQIDRTIKVMFLSEFNGQFEQHDHFAKHI